MNSKEKAKELTDRFIEHTDCAGDAATVTEAGAIMMKHAKECSLIAVDEIIKSQPFDIYTVEQCDNVNKYWQDVIKELNKL